MIKRALACSRRSSARASSVRLVASKRPDRLQGAADQAFLVLYVPLPLSLTDAAFGTFRRLRQAPRCPRRWCAQRNLPAQFPPCSSRESCARQASMRDATSCAISMSSSSAVECLGITAWEASGPPAAQTVLAALRNSHCGGRRGSPRNDESYGEVKTLWADE